MTSFKFWQFGCWNNLNTIDGVVQGRSNDVMKFIKRRFDEIEIKPNRLIISGDNYYPHKNEDKKKDKSLKDETTKDKKKG